MKKFFVTALVMLSLVALGGCKKAHVHTLEHIEAHEAINDATLGNSEYWHCEYCGKYFSDANAEHEIEKDSWVTHHVHSTTKVAAVEATKENPTGNTEYYTCPCGKYFSDAAAEHEIEKDSWVTSYEEFTLKVVDLDGEVLHEGTYATSAYNTVFDCLVDNCNVVYTTSDYGPYITSINGSVVDANWSMMFYENGVESWSNSNAVAPQGNASYEFRNECWAAVDYGYGAKFKAYDVTIDKAIYSYAKNQLKEKVEGVTTYTGSTYWEMLFVENYKRAGYDASLVNYTVTEELKTALNSVDVTTLSGANLGKYYTHAKVAGTDLAAFTTAYKEKLSAVTTWSDYVTPFVVLPAAELDPTNEALLTLCSSAKAASTSWGGDAFGWEVSAIEMFVSRPDFVLTDLLKDMGGEKGNATSEAIILAALCAQGNDPRSNTYGPFTNKAGETCDFMERFVEKYYDAELGCFKVYTTDTAFNFSSNQVYANLLAYKMFRDSGKAASVMGPVLPR